MSRGHRQPQQLLKPGQCHKLPITLSYGCPACSFAFPARESMDTIYTDQSSGHRAGGEDWRDGKNIEGTDQGLKDPSFPTWSYLSIPSPYSLPSTAKLREAIGPSQLYFPLPTPQIFTQEVPTHHSISSCPSLHREAFPPQAL